MATEGLKDVEVGLMFVPYYSSLCMPLLLDPILRSIITAGFAGRLSLVGLVTQTDGDKPTGTNRVQLR